MDNFREDKHKYMDLVQGVINRMASNSFALKGWAVTLVAGIFALASKDADKCYFIIAEAGVKIPLRIVKEPEQIDGKF